MHEDAKLDLYEGTPLDLIDLQKDEGEPEKHIQLVYDPNISAPKQKNNSEPQQDTLNLVMVGFQNIIVNIIFIPSRNFFSRF